MPTLISTKIKCLSLNVMKTVNKALNYIQITLKGMKIDVAFLQETYLRDSEHPPIADKLEEH